MAGEKVGVKFAECFTQHRGHAFPKENLLASLLQNFAFEL
jgi:hypothetical protein